MLNFLLRKKEEKLRLSLAQQFRANRQFSEAINQLEIALNINPRNNNARVLMSRMKMLSKL